MKTVARKPEIMMGMGGPPGGFGAGPWGFGAGGGGEYPWWWRNNRQGQSTKHKFAAWPYFPLAGASASSTGTRASEKTEMKRPGTH